MQLSLDKDAAQVQRYEERGVQAAAKCAFVLVAGGLGERLGYHGIKVRRHCCWQPLRRAQ